MVTHKQRQEEEIERELEAEEKHIQDTEASARDQLKPDIEPEKEKKTEPKKDKVQQPPEVASVPEVVSPPVAPSQFPLKKGHFRTT